MDAFHIKRYPLRLPATHRFPAGKYERLVERCTTASPDGLNLRAAPAAAVDDLKRAHDADYVARVIAGRLSQAEIRALGFPWSPALAARSRRSVGATLAAVAAARRDGIALSLAGGTHHAGRTRGGGFCVFNDVAAAALKVLSEAPGERIVIIDADVHQGDGTADILAAETRAFTLSIHAARNYPHAKVVSDLDINLPDRAGGADYLAPLERGLDFAMARMSPTLVIYIAGADVFAGDRLGRLDLSMADCGERDRRVLAAAEHAGAAVALVMGGGYAEDIDATVAIHYQTVLIALAAAKRFQRGPDAADPVTPATC